ncbi:MAG: bifunctional molybdopterin-guanine dinucleotide biosynthesis adaptor protein MobB/molybdopterin molybdotransferase MoeA [Gammaproteobacteria bacterium]
MHENEIQHQPGCEDELNTGLLTVAQAQARILAGVTPVTASETLPVREALGRVLAQDIVSPIDVPSHTNSAMDGYAVRAADLPASGVREFPVPGTSWAGRPWLTPIEPGQAVQIMTGGMMPAGADTVVMQEQVEREGDTVRIGAGHRCGQNVRAAGEDLTAGQQVFTAGKQLTAADIGVLASLGMSEVSVYRRLKVAFFSTGDELRSVGETLGPGEIYDSNRYTLYGMLKKLDVEIIDMGVVRDERELVEQAFHDAAASADAIITSGGVSVGEADYVKETLEKLGNMAFWKIAMKPGRPVTFGRINDAVFFGLPGNPVSVMVTYFQFVRPALLKMAGETGALGAFTLHARAASALRKRPGRYEFQRGVLEQSAPGEFTVRSAGAQGSGILRSMSEANCFILLDPDRTSVEIGEEVEVQPFQNLI